MQKEQIMGRGMSYHYQWNRLQFGDHLGDLGDFGDKNFI